MDEMDFRSDSDPSVVANIKKLVTELEQLQERMQALEDAAHGAPGESRE